MNPKISIIVPCYMQAQYLGEALQSVYDQTFQEWECIIVNDGSLDHTEEVALKWVNKDSRFKYVSKENGGLSSARNAGIKIALGEYIQLLDCDDLLHKDKFQKQIEFLDQSTDIVICDYFPFDQDSGIFLKTRYMNPFADEINYKNDIILKWESELSIPCHCVLFKVSLLKQNIEMGFDETLPNHEDWVFWVKIFQFSKGISNLREVLVSYRIHNNSMCVDKTMMKRGFIEACNLNSAFFKDLNNKKGIKLCEEKLGKIINIHKSNNDNLLKIYFRKIKNKILEYL